ncbi:restriction endonuclease subunit S [Rhodococcus erythropolis]|uniref:restriction endonuclease subunit S n=1 Tax=Rhodococcus erythropolis TaxID=1833 RepID=UPI00406BC718
MNWLAYPEYKESDIEWLGGVPQHWSVDRLKWSVESSQNGIWGSDPDGGPDDIRCVRVADFDRPKFTIQDRDVTYRKVIESERSGRLLSDGDLILEKSGGGEKNPVGFVVLYNRDEPAVTSNFVARVTLRTGMEPRFWTYLHHWLYASRLTQPSIKQTSGIQNLDQQSYFDERVCFPPAEEQVLIADFLDRETAKIDALIGKQEQLIATLREDRAATITHAVTKGLDSDVEMKDAEVDWVDSIPDSWSRMPFLRCMQGRVDYRGATPKKVDAGVLLITARNVRPGLIDYTTSEEYVSPEEYADIMRRGIPDIDDLLFTMEAPLGYVALVDRTDIALAQRIIKFRADRDAAMPRFLMYAMMSDGFQFQLTARATGSTALGLKASKLSELRVALPPIDDQMRISDFLGHRCAQIDAVIAKSTEMIETLKEYRSALITDSVTGKIDVRGVS